MKGDALDPILKFKGSQKKKKAPTYNKVTLLKSAITKTYKSEHSGQGTTKHLQQFEHCILNSNILRSSRLTIIQSHVKGDIKAWREEKNHTCVFNSLRNRCESNDSLLDSRGGMVVGSQVYQIVKDQFLQLPQLTIMKVPERSYNLFIIKQLLGSAVRTRSQASRLLFLGSLGRGAFLSLCYTGWWPSKQGRH